MEKSLRLGSTGGDVKRLQHLLNLTDTSLPRLKEDSVFGHRTLTRVTEFQKDNGLNPDGIVGSKTEKTLMIRAPKVVPDLETRMIKLDFDAKQVATRRQYANS